MSILSSMSKFNLFKSNNLKFESVTDLRIESLYRYYSFDQDSNYVDILNNILYFPSRNLLNDPFDSSAPSRYDLCSEKQLFRYLSELLDSRVNHIVNKEEEIKKALNRLKKDPDSIQKTIDEDLERRVGILSFSTQLDNLLLWAHYANKHTGFCVEFDAGHLQGITIHEFMKNRELAFLFKVKYQKKFPKIVPCKRNEEERMKLQFLVKSKEWKYEKEWRIILLNGSQVKVEIPKSILKNIYFGMNANEKNIRISRKILKDSNPEIGIYKAIKKKYTFGLEFERI